MKLLDWLRRYIGESWRSSVEAYRDLFWGLIADVEREVAAAGCQNCPIQGCQDLCLRGIEGAAK